MLRDMAVRHPTAGVRDLEQDVDGLAVRTSTVSFQARLAPDHSVAGENEEAASAVDVEGCGIGWSESISLTRRSFTWSPTRKRQSICAFSAPVSRSTSFQRMFAGVVIRLTSIMSSSPRSLAESRALGVLRGGLRRNAWPRDCVPLWLRRCPRSGAASCRTSGMSPPRSP